MRGDEVRVTVLLKQALPGAGFIAAAGEFADFAAAEKALGGAKPAAVTGAAPAKPTALSAAGGIAGLLTWASDSVGND